MKAFLMSSGTEATECAVRLMRLYTKRKKIVSIKGAMHGRTMACQLMKGTGEYQHPDFINLPYPKNNFHDLDKTKKQLLSDLKGTDPKEIAGFMLETYEGWSARFLPQAFIQVVDEYASNRPRHPVARPHLRPQRGVYRPYLLRGF